MEIVRSKRRINASKHKYVHDLLSEIGMLGYKLSDTPIGVGKKSKHLGEAVYRKRNQRIVGKLIYSSHTRPNIAFAFSAISHYIHFS